MIWELLNHKKNPLQKAGGKKISFPAGTGSMQQAESDPTPKYTLKKQYGSNMLQKCHSESK